MALFIPPFVSELTGIGLNMRDWQHAARLYVDDTYRLAPKPKWLFYAVFNINPNVINAQAFQDQNKRELNYLVKKMDLPRYTLNVENLNQYNRKTTSYTRINYDPVNVTFHDDNLGVTNGLWALYYSYYFADRLNTQSPYTDINPPAYQQHTYDPKAKFPYRYGLDNNVTVPFFSSIQLLTLSRHKFTSYLLCNPKITSWQHDTVDQSEGNGVIENNMTLAYDAVIYTTGTVAIDKPSGFGVLHYDRSQSPLNPFNVLFLQGTELASIYAANEESNNTFNPVDVGISRLQQATSNPYVGNRLPYGYGQNINLNPSNTPFTTSGLSSYNFGSGTNLNQTIKVVQNNNLYPRYSAPVEENVINQREIKAQGINDQFSSTTGGQIAPVVSDVYSNNLPRSTPASVESQIFGNINTGRSLPESSGAVNINYFIQGDAVINNNITTEEILSNNPQAPDIPDNPFA